MIYHVFANRSNIGDWLSAKGIQTLLQPHTVTECLCDEPFIEETMDRLSGATANDLIVIGGGGLFMDYFVPFWEAFEPISPRVPFCIWGVGVCDLKQTPSLPSGRLINDIVARSKLCIVRDDLTRAFLRDVSVPSAIACPSLNVVYRPPQRGRGVLHVVNYTTVGAEAYDAMRPIGQAFAAATSKPYRETNNLINKGSEKELDALLLRYSDSDIVLSSALHGCVIGVGMGLKVVAVSGDRKIDAFMHSVDLGEWVLDVDQLDTLPNRLTELGTQVHSERRVDNIRGENEKVAAKILQVAQSLS